MDNALLQAISDMMDSKLAPITERLDRIEGRMDKLEGRMDKMENRMDKMEIQMGEMGAKIDKMETWQNGTQSPLEVIEYKQDKTLKKLNDLQLDVKVVERNITGEIHTLRDEMDTVLQALKMHKIVQL